MDSEDNNNNVSKPTSKLSRKVMDDDTESPVRDREEIQKNLKSKTKLKKVKTNDSGSDDQSPAKSKKQLGSIGGNESESLSSPAMKKQGNSGTAAALAAGKSLMKKPPKRKENKDGIPGGGLSKDFESFDILWFDLASKTR